VIVGISPLDIFLGLIFYKIQEELVLILSWDMEILTALILQINESSFQLFVIL
jgi:hypothetical protein